MYKSYLYKKTKILIRSNIFGLEDFLGSLLTYHALKDFLGNLLNFKFIIRSRRQKYSNASYVSRLSKRSSKS